jgi:uncharacterized membrane protein
MSHSHGHGHDAPPTPPEMQRRLAVAVAPFALATLVGLFVLWPSADPLGDIPGPVTDAQFDAEVTSVDETDCSEIGQGPGLECFDITVRLAEGPDSGDTVEFPFGGGSNAATFEPGDSIVMGRSTEAPEGSQYYFVDFQRTTPLIILAILFAVVVVALSRWRGLAALSGLAVSIFILLLFVLPAILDGKNPLAVAIVGSSAIMFVALYLAHGINARTSTAVLGTLASLALTGILAVIFVELASFTGLSSEEATFLQLQAETINLKGLLLGGVVIGALGVLDDVTVTQASAVWELHQANPEMGVRRLYSSALRIGRDHIASTVNTLVLAYVGASLPLLVLFSISSRPLGSVISSEVVAEEIVRTLVGSIGLVASVPITTALAAMVVSGGSGLHLPGRPRDSRRRPTTRQPRRGTKDRWKPPRAERDWRGE